MYAIIYAKQIYFFVHFAPGYTSFTDPTTGFFLKLVFTFMSFLQKLGYPIGHPVSFISFVFSILFCLYF